MAQETRGLWWNLARGVWYPTKWVAGPHRFIGMEHIPRTGPVLAVANHISYLDPIYTGIFFDQAGRIPRFLAKEAVFRMPAIGKLARELGQIPVRRGGAQAVDSLREADKALAEGHVVAIYPEGTVTRDPAFWPMRAHTGAARLALDHDVPIIPIAHWGTQKIYDHYDGKKFRPFPRTRVILRAGPPIDVTELRARPRSGEQLRDMTHVIMTSLRDLLADVRGEEPPVEFHPRHRS